MSNLISGDVNTYVEWLTGYIAKGGVPTHFYGRKMRAGAVLVATGDFRLGGECGAAAKQIVVPAGLNWVEGDCGHNGLYFLDGFDEVGGFVPGYIDPEFLAIPGYLELLEEYRAKELAKAIERIEGEVGDEVTVLLKGTYSDVTGPLPLLRKVAKASNDAHYLHPVVEQFLLDPNYGAEVGYALMRYPVVERFLHREAVRNTAAANSPIKATVERNWLRKLVGC